jgi:leader peptidase (prepilin peptidase) / N-methyltransferase
VLLVDYLPPIAGGLAALAVTWMATGYQHYLYRLSEHRVPAPAGPRRSARRLIVSAVAAIAVALTLRPDHYDPGPALLASAFIVVLCVMASTDLERRLLPNRLMYPALAAAALVIWAWPERSAADSLLGGAAAFGFGAGLFILGTLIGVALRVKATVFGLGDVKLMLLVGLLVGWPAVVSALFLGIIAAGVPALAMTLVGKGRQVFPYGPFLILGALVVMLWPDAFD